jgi:hypothetical protein
MSTTSVSELGYLFLTMSSLHIIAPDLDVRDHSMVDEGKALMMSNPITQKRIFYYNITLTTVKKHGC